MKESSIIIGPVAKLRPPGLARGARHTFCGQCLSYETMQDFAGMFGIECLAINEQTTTPISEMKSGGMKWPGHFRNNKCLLVANGSYQLSATRLFIL